MEHALNCKKGGLIAQCHHELAGEWHHLCASATMPSAVSDEPIIHTSRDSTAAVEEGEVLPEIRGDVAVKGFWRRDRRTVFDVRVTDTDNPSQRGQKVKKVLVRHENEKKRKYLQPCLDARQDFTPLVFSVDGVRGIEAARASKRCAALLSKKWRRTYSHVCGFVRSRLCFASVRSASMCLRGSRNPTRPRSRFIWDNGAGLALYS